MGNILGASQGDYDKLAGQVYSPNASNYNNSAIPGSLSQLQGVGSGLSSLSQAGIGNQGLADQQSAFQSLQNLANGTGPSLARANMQAGLAQTIGNLSNQAMSNQGNVGAGNSQRNLLNAQANAANAVQQSGAQASAAEQLGAMQQLQGAAQGLTAGELNQGNFQLGTLNAAGQNAIQGANVGQMQTNNNMALDSANSAAQTQRLGYQLQGDQATANQFKTGLGYLGQVANIAGSVAAAVGTGGMSTLAQGAAGALSGGGGGGAGMSGNAGALSNDYVTQQLGQRANNSFNNLYAGYQG